MELFGSLLDAIKTAIRRLVHGVAIGLNRLSGGKVSPNAVTIVGFLGHLPIAWLIYRQQLVAAAVLLVVFGLFDTLDGELARVQQRTSALGMLLDSTADRLKEIVLYCGLTAYVVQIGRPFLAVAAVAALGTSMSTSYISARGDVVMTTHRPAGHTVNKSLRGGLLPFEIRMFLIVVGLLFNLIPAILYIILVLASITVLERLARVTRRLKHVQS